MGVIRLGPGRRATFHSSVAKLISPRASPLPSRERHHTHPVRPERLHRAIGGPGPQTTCQPDSEYGVFAPNCKLRTAVMPKQRKKLAASPDHAQTPGSHGDRSGAGCGEDLITPLNWAQRLRRVFLMEITVCPHCCGTLRIIGDVTYPARIERILVHVRKRGPPEPLRTPPPTQKTVPTGSAALYVLRCAKAPMRV